MRVNHLIAAMALFCALPALAQTPAGFVYGQVPTPSQWNALFAGKQDVLGAAAISASMLASGAAAANLGTTFVSNNAGLSALASTAFSQVTRFGYAAAGDAPSATFTSSASACSLNSGAGDGGSQVPSADGKCWTAQFPPSGADVRAWGCFPDGVTDVGGCISTAAANYGGKVILPASTNGFYVNTMVQANWNLVGEAFSAVNNMPTNTYARTSWLKCSATVTPCVRLDVNGSLSHSPVLENIIIAGAAGTPGAGVVGLQVAGGYALNLRNLFIVNFDTCLKLGPESTYAGLSLSGYNINMGACQTHFTVIDGWPEAKFIGGRWGLNGTGDYAGANEYLLQTLTTAVGAGGGPNTITLDDVQLNSSAGMACAFNWEGFTGSGGVTTETRLANVHTEFHSYTGSHKRGIFCSDSTVPLIQQLYVTNMLSTVGGAGTVPVFNFDPLTALKQVYFSNNTLGCSSSNITLAPTPASGPSFEDVHFSNNTGCSSASFTSNGVGNNIMFTNGNRWNGLTIAGSWLNLNMINDDIGASLIDTATGHVAFSNSLRLKPWTPTLTFGGASTGITYSTQSASVARTPTGGFYATFSITLTSKGSATGAAQITGIPFACGSGFGSANLGAGSTSLSGLTGAVSFAMNGGAGSPLSVVQSSAGGVANLTDTSFTNTTTINGTVSCGTTS